MNLRNAQPFLTYMSGATLPGEKQEVKTWEDNEPESRACVILASRAQNSWK